jgi:archaellum component FlaC
VATNSVLAKLAVQISANTAEFNKNLASTQKNLQSFTGNITALTGAVGIAFGGRELAGFVLDVSKLSGEAEGVRAAFERLPNATKLMMDLKEATGGTVSELDLMKRAVQASNFDISLAALPKLLQFATLRAQQTGQSVDYLVDSIVTGIGRKSKLILDNLGISAVQLNKALGGVTTGVASIGDVADAVGKIADENLNNMAAFSENASTKLQRLEASWVNIKVAIGDAANSVGLLGGSVDAIAGAFNLLASKDTSFWEAVSALFQGPGASSSAAIEDYVRKLKRINEEHAHQELIVKQVDQAYKEFKGDIDAYG